MVEPQTPIRRVDDHLGGSGSLMDTNVGLCCLVPTMAAVWITAHVSQRDLLDLRRLTDTRITTWTRTTWTRNISVIFLSDFAWTEGSSHP